MIHAVKTSIIAFHVAVFALAAVAGATTGRGETSCIGSWSEAAPIVAANGLTPVETLTREAPERLNGNIVKATLCEEDGRYIYSLVLRQEGGKLKQKKVDARRPY
jgi:uncharacterized membrane protein YkoI